MAYTNFPDQCHFSTREVRNKTVALLAAIATTTMQTIDLRRFVC